MTDAEWPVCIEAEQSVVGCILVYPDAIGDVVGRVNPSDFYLRTHQDILRSAIGLYNDGAPVNALTIIESTGTDPIALADIVEHACVPGCIRHHCSIVLDRSAKRALLAASRELDKLAHADDPGDDVVRRAVDIVRSCYRTDVQTLNGRGLLEAFAVACDHRWHNPADTKPLGVPTGFESLDEMLAFEGLPRGHITTVGGDTSGGKSALMQAFCRTAAKNSGPVLDVTLEDTARTRMVRHLAAESRLQNRSLQREVVEGDDWMTFTREIGEACRWAHRVHFLDRTNRGVPVDELLQRAHRVVEDEGVVLTVFDYLQLIPSGQRLGSTQQAHIDYVFDAVETWAGQHPGTAVALGSQFKRRIDEAKRPMLSDLYHSAKLEQGSHTVLLIWDPPDGRDFNMRALDVAKQKDGPRGVVPLGWWPRSVLWHDPDPLKVDDYMRAIAPKTR